MKIKVCGLPREEDIVSLLNSNIENFDSGVLNFSISSNFIWKNHINYCELLNISSNNKWQFSE